jgi:hypothetical protein
MSDIAIVDAKTLSTNETIQLKFKDILGENYKFFMQSVVNSISLNSKLLECDGKSV